MKNNKNNKNKFQEFIKNNSTWIVLLLTILILSFIRGDLAKNLKKEDTTNYIPYTEFEKMVKNKEVKYVFFNSENYSSIQFIPTNEYLKKKGTILTTEYKENLKIIQENKDTLINPKLLPQNGVFKYITENPNSDNFRENLLKNGIRVFSVKNSKIMSTVLMVLLNFLPLFLIFALLIHFQNRLEPKEEDLVTEVPDTRFSSIAGYEPIKKDSEFILDFLKNPKAYEEIGARLPNGVLFYGPPGTGKTLMAKAIAGEASVPFYKINGSDFVELYVGLGAKRVRNLYKIARENAPCIVFIDEIDSIGQKRGGFRGSSEDDKTLTALLNELDGFSAKKGIITIAATNRLKDLDPALIRPGRFDRQIAVPLPDKEERFKILELYAKGKKIDPSVDIKILSNKTIDFSPSELENLLNEAAINAVTRKSNIIENKDIDESFVKIIMKGHKKEDKHQTKEEKKIIAYHEAGHAIVGHILGKPILEVSIIGTTSGAGGYTLSQPKEGLMSKTDMKNEIKELYGGRAGETMIVKDKDDITIGAMNDIEVSTNIISNYIKILGLNGSLINYEELGVKRPNKEIIKEAEKISKELFEETLDILKKNKNKLNKLATTLLKESQIDREAFLKIMNETKEDYELKESESNLDENEKKENNISLENKIEENETIKNI